MKQKLLILFTALAFSFTGFSQAVAYDAPPITQCGNEVFNLTQQTTIILGNQNPANFAVGYFTSLANASSNSNVITNPSVFIGQSSQTIYARVTSGLDSTFDTTSFTISWVISPQLNPMADVMACDFYTLPPLSVGNYYTAPGGAGFPIFPFQVITTSMTVYVYATDGTCFSETSFQVTIVETPQVPPQPNVTSCGPYTLPTLPQGMGYFYDAAGTVPFTVPVIVESMTVFVVAQSPAPLTCISTASFEVTIGDIPEVQLDPYVVCGDNGIAIFDLDAKAQEIIAEFPTVTVSFHETQLDGQIGANALQSPYTNLTNPQTIYVRVTSQDNVCSMASPFSLLATCTNNSISGTILFDNESNGCDTGDLPAANVQVVCANGNDLQYAYTNDAGNYAFTSVSEGANTVSVQAGLANFMSVSPTAQTLAMTGNNNDLDAEFCVTYNALAFDASITVIPNSTPRPGLQASYTVLVTNHGSATLNGTTTLTFDGTRLTLVSSSPAPISQSGNSVTFDFTGLPPYGTQLFYVIFLVATPPTANAGDVLLFSANVATSDSETNLDDNAFSFSQTVVNSYDPNDMMVLEGPVITEAQADGYLNYIVRFQNTGLAEAINIRITNALDSDLDWSTFLPLASSHSYQAERSGGDVTFSYTGINLPASTVNELGSHGFIAYKVKPKANFAIGEIISNTANIYFDFNAPIITNTVTTQIQSLGITGQSTGDFRMYPNPVSDFLAIAGNFETDLDLSIYDIQGKLLLQKRLAVTGNSALVNVSGLPSGLYLVRMVSGEKMAVKKLVVE